MANYNNLKATINANIKANGNEEITGPILNTVLNQAVTTLGDGWSYKGIATPSMSPGTPDSNVFYIATTAGTYTNFGSLVVAEGEVAILKYNGSWAKEVTGAATAAQVTQLGQEMTAIMESTDNIIQLQGKSVSIYGTLVETSSVGKIKITGTATSSGGRTTKLCTPFTLPAGSYRMVFSATPVAEIFVEKVSGDTIIAQKSSPAFTLDSATDIYIGANVVSGRTYSDVFGIAIFADQSKTDYKPTITAVDFVARAQISELLTAPSEYDYPTHSQAGIIKMTPKFYIDTYGNVGDAVTLDKTANNNYEYAVVKCTQGDKFLVTGRAGGSSAKVAVFVDANNVILWQVTTTATSQIIVAPAGTAKLILCNNTIGQYRSYFFNEESVSDHFAILDLQGERNIISRSGYFIKSDGTIATGEWNIYAIPVTPGFTYEITSWLNEIGNTAATKKQWVLLSIPVTTPISYSANDIVKSGQDLGGAVVGQGFLRAYTTDVITIPSNGRTLIVAEGIQSGFNNGVKVKIVSPGARQYTMDDIFPNPGVFAPRTFINTESSSPMLLTTTAKGAGTVGFRAGYLYTSGFYDIADSTQDREITKEWRIPVLKGQFIRIEFKSVVSVTSAFLRYENSRTRLDCGVRLDAHLGFQTLAPENSMAAYEAAALYGYPACIVNPIASADGTLFCYHENDNSLELNGVVVSLSATEFASKTDMELSEYKVVGLSKVKDVGGYSEPIPTLEEFFRLCAITGMRPMFSTHPALSDASWDIVKNLLAKYNLTSKFSVKAFSISILEKAFSLFGNSIDSYIYDVEGTDYATYISQLQNSTLQGATIRVGIEYPASSMTATIASATLSAGYFVSVWSVGTIDGNRYKQLMDMGVSEFTDDVNCNYGLYW